MVCFTDKCADLHTYLCTSILYLKPYYEKNEKNKIDLGSQTFNIQSIIQSLLLELRNLQKKIILFSHF